MTRQTRIETDPRRKTFLFLQGPHGPFFDRLGRMSTRAGATVWRVGFNAGDRAFWFTPDTYIPYRGPVTD
jgi:capsular polysaccharide export protein